MVHLPIQSKSIVGEGHDGLQLPIHSKVSEEYDDSDVYDLTLAPSEVYVDPGTNWPCSPSPTQGLQDDEAFPAVFGTNVTRLDTAYVARRSELGERFVAVQGGRRKLCFWTDGESSGIPVIAFHGGCDTKCRFIQKQPLPGVYLIAVDRPGYGGSSPVPLEYTFKQAVEDILVLAEHLGVDKFVVMGHGVGASFALQIAAAVPQRVRGAIVWSTMADPLHPKATQELRKAQGYRGGVMFARSGFCYCSPRSFMVGSKKTGAKKRILHEQ
jgi:hypothetical protein